MAGEVLAIELGRTQMESSAQAGAQPEEEEEEGDGTVSVRFIAATQLAHEWVGVCSICPTCSCCTFLL